MAKTKNPRIVPQKTNPEKDQVEKNDETPQENPTPDPNSDETPEKHTDPETPDTPEAPDENQAPEEQAPEPNEPPQESTDAPSDPAAQLNNPLPNPVTVDKTLKRPEKLKTKADFQLDGMISLLENFERVPASDPKEIHLRSRDVYAPVQFILDNPTYPVLAAFIKVLKRSSLTTRDVAEMNRIMFSLSEAEHKRFAFVMALLKGIAYGSIKSTKDFNHEQLAVAVGAKYKANVEKLIQAVKTYLEA